MKIQDLNYLECLTQTSSSIFGGQSSSDSVLIIDETTELSGDVIIGGDWCPSTLLELPEGITVYAPLSVEGVTLTYVALSIEKNADFVSDPSAFVEFG